MLTDVRQISIAVVIYGLGIRHGIRQIAGDVRHSSDVTYATKRLTYVMCAFVAYASEQCGVCLAYASRAPAERQRRLSE
jgi:hypothetical protein